MTAKHWWIITELLDGNPIGLFCRLGKNGCRYSGCVCNCHLPRRRHIEMPILSTGMPDTEMIARGFER